MTGASSGIGAAIAQELHRRGAEVVLVARRAERMEAMRAQSPNPERFRVAPADLSKEGERERLWREGSERFGVPDLIVHAAGVSQRSFGSETQLSTVRRIMEINFFAPVHLSQLALSAMVQRGSGHLAVISSVVGYVSTPKRSTYAASKHALHGWFEGVRSEVGGQGIRITIACAGYVKTEIGAHSLTADGSAQGAHGVERGMSAERCGAAVVTGIERDRPELYIGGKEIGAIYLRRFLPGLVRWFGARATPD